MKRNIYFILSLFILIGLTISLTGVYSVENETFNQKVGGVDFKIPLKYKGGNLSNDGTTYIYNSLNEFGILRVDTFLKNSYGYDASKGYCENIILSNHEGVHITYYNNYIKDNISKFYYPVGDFIFELSWKGNRITSEIEDIIVNSPPSTLSSYEFNNALSNARNEYLNEEKYEEQYYNDYSDPYYKDSYSDSLNMFPIYYSLYEMSK